MELAKHIVAPRVDHLPERPCFARRVGRKDKHTRLIAHGGDFGDEDVHRPAFPALIVVERLARSFETDLENMLVRALHERTDIGARADGAGHDRAVRAGRVLGDRGLDWRGDQEDRRDRQQETEHRRAAEQLRKTGRHDRGRAGIRKQGATVRINPASECDEATPPACDTHHAFLMPA